MNKAFVLIFALLVSNASVATITVEREIKRIYANGERVNFRLKDDATCNPNNKYYYFRIDSEIKKLWFPLLLAAANTNKSVSVSIDECPTNDNVEINYLYQEF